MKNLFKILSLIFTLLFIWAAYVQYNDPDALLWYALYGVAAAASLLFYLGKLNVTGAVILSGIYFVSTFLLWPEQFEGVTIGNGDIVNIERGRETLGLLIVAIIMLIYAFRLRLTNKSKV
ncbi:MAG: transmembrane 220 family protein [Eudoraea sp.]|nr:transmembrane 220 family protein [Eudoraea sp.]